MSITFKIPFERRKKSMFTAAALEKINIKNTYRLRGKKILCSVPGVISFEGYHIGWDEPKTE